MALAIILGIIVGIIGFLPLVASIYIMKRTRRAGVGTNMATTLLSLVISFVFYIATILIYRDLSSDTAIAFAITIAITLSIVAIGYGIFKNIQTKK